MVVANVGEGFIRSVRLQRESVSSFEEYPLCIPAIRSLDVLSLHPKVTFFVGDNASGKSTLLEAIAICAGFNAEGGTRNFTFSTRCSASVLHRYLHLTRNSRREQTEFFLRAESYFNLATEIEALDREPANAPPIADSYGVRALHEQSHGESFLALANNRFGPEGLYLLDEPEAALSPSWQLAFLKRINDLVRNGSQFIIVTHSPILLAYPVASIMRFGPEGLREIKYRDTEHFQLTQGFLNDPEQYLKHLFENDS